MILTTKRAYKKRGCNCETTCNCNKPKRIVNIANNYDDESNFDDENRFDNASTLEEHFENFGEAIGELAENFSFRTKAGRQRAKVRQEARQEKRLSRIKGRQTLREARVKSKLQELESAPETKEQAETQAQQVNQLASAVQPQSAPISAVETPTGSGYNAPLYQTLPMQAPSGLTGMSGGSMGTEEQQPEAQAQDPVQQATQTPETKAQELTPAESPKKKGSKTIYLIIGAVAIAGVIYFMRKKK